MSCKSAFRLLALRSVEASTFAEVAVKQEWTWARRVFLESHVIQGVKIQDKPGDGGFLEQKKVREFVTVSLSPRLKPQSVTTQMKATEQHFDVVLLLSSECDLSIIFER